MERILDISIDAMKRVLRKDDRITVVGFGIFSVSTGQTRGGRNPKTGEAIKISASKTVTLEPGSVFKQVVKQTHA
jgi:DNA-binding protein HU-beta